MLLAPSSGAGLFVGMVDADHGDVLGASDLTRERDELKDKCEALE